MNAEQAAISAQTKEAAVGIWTHLKFAFARNDELADRVLWCLTVDWHRALAKQSHVSSRLDRLYHTVLCWEWWAVFQYRLNYWAHARSLPDLRRAPRFLRWLATAQQAALLRFGILTGRLAEALSGARLNPESEIGPGLLLMHSGSCGIGRGSRIGANFTMYQDANVASRRGDDKAFPTLGDNVTLYAGARVIGAVIVGNDVHVGANALVINDLPPGCLALGVPARPVLPGGKPPDYPASLQVRDLVLTLLQNGALEEVEPGRYRDRATGDTISVVVPAPEDAG